MPVNAGFDISVQSTLFNFTKRCIIEQAQFIPGSTRSFYRNVIACYELDRGVLVCNQLSYNDTPLVLMTAFTNEANEKMKD